MDLASGGPGDRLTTARCAASNGGMAPGAITALAVRISKPLSARRSCAPHRWNVAASKAGMSLGSVPALAVRIS
eukprot:NODE_6319_length_515_cov_231.802174.p2 GENE.NODE_6319_length_515_cov_231.802174~~NODE_6319_length_515_cov_231.802174.p2  ORF type:complete len:74 (-),score=4.94 NODE_6319_length_515_cov_231.802174:71-292(-)